MMTLEKFLIAMCINRHNLISILSHDETVLYFIEGKEMFHSKLGYLDPVEKKTVLIGTNDLSKLVTNFAFSGEHISIYVKEAQL